MNLRDVTASQRRLLGELTGRISNRLEANFAQPSGTDSLNIGVMLQERGKKGALEVPETVLLEAETDLVARDSLRLRIKSARDRMLFIPPPARLRTDIAPAGEPFFNRGGFGRGGGGGGRGRR
jgi:hypothetical protein